MPHEYASFSPLAYSLDLILPVVGLDQAKNWRPITIPIDRDAVTRPIFVTMIYDLWSLIRDVCDFIYSFGVGVINFLAIGKWNVPNWREHVGGFIRFVTWLENIFGWAASLLMVATLSGLVKKDDG